MIEKNLKILWCAFGRIIQFQVGRSTVEEAGKRAWTPKTVTGNRKELFQGSAALRHRENYILASLL